MIGLKRFLPRSLLGRSLLIIVTPLALLQLVSTIVFYERHWDTVTRRSSILLAGEIGLLADHLQRFPDAESQRWILDTAASRMDIHAGFEAGAKLTGEAPAGTAPDIEDVLAPALGEVLGRPFRVGETAIEHDIEVRVQLPDGVLTTSTTRKRLFSPTTYIFTLWMVGSSLVLVAIATIFMRNQVRPIRRLAAAANSFGKGRDVPNFRPAGATEVRQAAQAFIEMRGRIKRQIEQRTEMLAGVSHDLRTPLTRMKLELAMLGESAEIEELKADVEEMGKMVDGYLAFARGEGAGVPEPADLAAVLEQVVASARKEGAEIDLHTEEQLVLPVRLDAIRRCFMNLILNAARYGKHVQVRAGRRAGAVEVLVDDDGPGIPGDQREAVFRAFFRLDPSRNIETGGVGLGLTIARDVVRAHGGEILLDDSPLGGLRARVRMPL